MQVYWQSAVLNASVLAEWRAYWMQVYWQSDVCVLNASVSIKWCPYWMQVYWQTGVRTECKWIDYGRVNRALNASELTKWRAYWMQVYWQSEVRTEWCLYCMQDSSVLREWCMYWMQIINVLTEWRAYWMQGYWRSDVRTECKYIEREVCTGCRCIDSVRCVLIAGIYWEWGTSPDCVLPAVRCSSQSPRVEHLANEPCFNQGTRHSYIATLRLTHSQSGTLP